MPTVLGDDLEIAYDRRGDGPLLVLVHGAASDARAWGPQLEDLADAFTVVAWDEPGAHAFAAAIPQAELVIIPGAGHVSNLERPEAFNAAVRAFCRAHPPAPSG